MRKRKGRWHVVRIIYGVCPCGRDFLYPYEARNNQCHECRNKARWDKFFANPDMFSSKVKASRGRVREINRQRAERGAGPVAAPSLQSSTSAGFIT